MKPMTSVRPLQPLPMHQASQAGFTFMSVQGAYEKICWTEGDKNWIDRFSLPLATSQASHRNQIFQALTKGVEWLLEPLDELQPRSHRAFFSAGAPKMFVADAIWQHAQYGVLNPCALFLDVGDRIIEVDGVTGDDGLGEVLGFEEWLSLPRALAKSWFWRVMDWTIPRVLPSSPLDSRQMVRLKMDGIDDIVRSLRLTRSESHTLLKELARRLHGAAPERQDERWNLRCFLDTRPVGVSGALGDQLFTQMNKADGTVYRIRNGDVAGLHILDNPGEAIDCYHEHLLLKRPGEFDFSPWARPLTLESRKGTP